MKGFDFVDMLQKLWSKRGTASNPLVFKDSGNGIVYEVVSAKTDDERKETVLELAAIRAEKQD